MTLVNINDSVASLSLAMNAGKKGLKTLIINWQLRMKLRLEKHERKKIAFSQGLTDPDD